jgi:putative ABC transport system permease protein
LFRNYLVTALRNIVRHKLHSFINIAGLAMGFTCAILIILFVRDELSFDKWIPGTDKIYRVESVYHMAGRPEMVTAQSSPRVAEAMGEQIPEVLAATRLASQTMTMILGDRRFRENVAVVDSNFLRVIPLPLVAGDPRTVLSQPQSVVLSQSAARKYFGDADPVGRTLSTGRTPCAATSAMCDTSPVPLTVTGVMRDLPHNTHIEAEMLVPSNSVVNRIELADRQNWLYNNGTFGYVVLADGADPARVLDKLKPILDRSIDISRFTGVRVPGSEILEIRLTPFLDAHLTTDRFGAMKPAGSWTILYGLILIGVLILLVASFNFMNLATARATLRAREISLRKCMGARRGQLIVQFLGESVLMAVTALMIAFALVEILLPVFGGFMARPLSFGYLSDWPLILSLLAIAILAGLFSGLYPALVLSSLRPAANLRSKAAAQSSSGRLRTGLVVLQFAVSIGLGIAALVVFQQIQFARNIDLGFRRDNVVVTGTGGLMPEGLESFAHALAAGPGVIDVARSSIRPFSGANDTLPLRKPGDPQVFSPTHIVVTPNYFRLYGIRLLAGRELSEKREEDAYYKAPVEDGTRNEGHNLMVNEVLARALGYAPADIIGQTFIFGQARMRVVGVVADTLADGVRKPVVQTVYVYSPRFHRDIHIRIQPGQAREALAHIERVSRQFVPSVALTQNFLSDNYARLYEADERQGSIFVLFVIIAILIACLGLFGLAAFTAARRTQEIGIRKVFGGRKRDVIFLLLWQFSIPVLLANILAWPIAWYYLQDWLRSFTYRIDLNPLPFAAAGLTALLIAWGTVFLHAWRVARASPIHALRYE